MNKHLTLSIVFPFAILSLLLTTIPVFSGNQSSSNPSAASSPPSSARQAQHPSAKKAKATRAQKISRKPIEVLGWCCQKGYLNKKKISQSECTKQRGTYIPLSSNPSSSCGFCSKNGKITAVTSKGQRNTCKSKSGKGHFYTSYNLAKKNLVWCCSNNTLQYTDKNSCNSVGQRYSQNKTQTFVKSCTVKTGYCTSNGRILSNTTQKKCIRLKGTFFSKRVDAQRDLFSKKAQVSANRGSLRPIGQKNKTEEPLSVAKTKKPEKPADRRSATQENKPDTIRPLTIKQSLGNRQLGAKTRQLSNAPGEPTSTQAAIPGLGQFQNAMVIKCPDNKWNLTINTADKYQCDIESYGNNTPSPYAYLAWLQQQSCQQSDHYNVGPIIQHNLMHNNIGDHTGPVTFKFTCQHSDAPGKNKPNPATSTSSSNPNPASIGQQAKLPAKPTCPEHYFMETMNELMYRCIHYFDKNAGLTYDGIGFGNAQAHGAWLRSQPCKLPHIYDDGPKVLDGIGNSEHPWGVYFRYTCQTSGPK